MLSQGTMSQADCYRHAYSYTGGNATSLATMLRKQDSVSKRIDFLKGSIADDTVLASRERRQILARIARTPIGEVDEHSPLAQEVVYETTGKGKQRVTKKKVKMPSKLQAIELDARLSGELDGGTGKTKAVRLRLVAQGATGQGAAMAAELDISTD